MTNLPTASGAHRLSNAEFIALRSMGREPWCVPRHHDTFYWKFNRTWRRAEEHETGVGVDAGYSLLYYGLAEERYCCENQCRRYWHLSPRGLALLARVNRARLVAHPSPDGARPGHLRAALDRFRQLVHLR